MNQEKFNQAVEDMKKYVGVLEVFLLNSEGIVVYKYGDVDFTDQEGISLLNAWKEKEPSLKYQNVRYAVLKNDDIQLAAKNVAGGKGNIAGSISKEGDYLLAHIAEETDLILLEWSILINKIAWS
jgi:hypothetical protein